MQSSEGDYSGLIICQIEVKCECIKYSSLSSGEWGQAQPRSIYHKCTVLVSAILGRYTLVEPMGLYMILCPLWLSFSSLTKIDLRDAYNRIRIHPDDR